MKKIESVQELCDLAMINAKVYHETLKIKIPAEKVLDMSALSVHLLIVQGKLFKLVDN